MWKNCKILYVVVFITIFLNNGANIWGIFPRMLEVINSILYPKTAALAIVNKYLINILKFIDFYNLKKYHSASLAQLLFYSVDILDMWKYFIEIK